MPGRAPTKPTREAIIESAQLLMARKGYSAVGINEILEHADNVPHDANRLPPLAPNLQPGASGRG